MKVKTSKLVSALLPFIADAIVIIPGLFLTAAPFFFLPESGIFSGGLGRIIALFGGLALMVGYFWLIESLDNRFFEGRLGQAQKEAEKAREKFLKNPIGMSVFLGVFVGILAWAVSSGSLKVGILSAFIASPVLWWLRKLQDDQKN